MILREVSRLSVSSADAGRRLDKFLCLSYPHLSASLIQKILRKKKVEIVYNPNNEISLTSDKVQQHKASASDRLHEGDIVVAPSFLNNKISPTRPARYIEKDSNAQEIKDASLLLKTILFENQHFIVMNKPSGMASQGGTLINTSVDRLWKLIYDNQLRGNIDSMNDKTITPHLVHRLDKAVSGCIVIAKSRDAAAILSSSIHQRDIKKEYWACVRGINEQKEGTITSTLLSDARSCVTPLLAVTGYRVISETSSYFSWLSLFPVTGRKHQLRIHCARHLSGPIVGDNLYGVSSTESLSTDSTLLRLLKCSPKYIFLHSRSITIPNNNSLGLKEPLTVVAPLPKHMSDLWKYFGWLE